MRMIKELKKQREELENTYVKLPKLFSHILSVIDPKDAEQNIQLQ